MTKAYLVERKQRHANLPCTNAKATVLDKASAQSAVYCAYTLHQPTVRTQRYVEMLRASKAYACESLARQYTN